MRRLSAGRRWGLVVAIAALALAALNFWWVLTYREGYPFEVDEAGYTSFGFVNYLALHHGGVDAWWDAIQAQPTFAPLVPALTSLLVWAHPDVLGGFFVLTGFMVLLALATYGIGLRLAGPRPGALAALVTATLPGTFVFSREYVYALPTAALLACAVYALLRSDGLRLRRWALACGAAIGLMLLSRTMAIVFVPGVLAAALVAMAARSQGDLGRRLLNGALLLAAAVAVAATWYARNLASAWDYLTSYGYGSQAEFYGEQHALISWGRFRTVGERIVGEDLFLPLALLVLAALTALAVVVVGQLGPRSTRREALRRLAGADALAVALILVGGYAALLSSRNGGNGFTLPLSVLLPPLAVPALRRFPAATVPALAILVPVIVFNTVSAATVWSAASRARSVSVPGFAEPFPITRGAPKALSILRVQIPGPETVFDERDEEWVRANERVAAMLNRLHAPRGEAPVIAFASRSRVLSSSAVQLASLLEFERGLRIVQLTGEPEDAVAGYEGQLRDSAFGPAAAMVSIVPTEGDYPPRVSQPRAVAAARRLGLRKTAGLRLPDGRRLSLWSRPGDS